MVAFFNSIYFHLKTYNQTNFFKHTFCEFHQVIDFKIPEEKHFKSKSASLYYYTKVGVYRKSNHWGRVANCRWRLITNKDYKNQQTVIAFAKWNDFFPLNDSEKIYYLLVDFKDKSVVIKPKKDKNSSHLFTFLEAQTRSKKIKHLFKEEKWAKYFNGTLDELRFRFITELINTNKTILQIKLDIK